jgi:transcription termination/antitermination protein NusG
MALRWYVVQAFSGFEGQVKRSLEERIARYGMGDHFGQILVPTEEVVEMRTARSARATANSFPATCWCRWT